MMRNVFLTLLAAGLMLSCGRENLGTVSAFLAASTQELDFGEVDIGSTESRTLFFYNEGTKIVALEDPVGDTYGDVYSISVPESEILPDKDLVVLIEFTPTSVGNLDTTISFPNSSTNATNLAVALKGTGVHPDPCYGVVCDQPPEAECISSERIRDYLRTGTCDAGVCTYTPREADCDNGCDFSTEQCRPGRCDNVNCTAAPPSYCVNSTTARHSDPFGVCSEGQCEHTTREEECEFGCDFDSGYCDGDPCEGVSCQSPPNSCFEANGTCFNGACTYNAASASCNDGDPCTADDTCQNGTCRGQPMACNTPPTPLCITDLILRVWEPLGVCDDGSCDYEHRNVQCQFGCDTGNGQCKNDPCAAGCDDGNPCTEDSCDEILGCQYENTNGTCVTPFRDCRIGECIGGECLPRTGETCVTEVNADLCQDVDVAGQCTASGQCVVSEAPPGMSCPGCPGICAQCFVQVCIPF